MKGFVPTPAPLVDHMVDKLFRAAPPTPSSTLLDPGCGAGAFVEGVIRWCTRAGMPIPKITALDSDPERLREARKALPDLARITLLQEDFLTSRREQFDYIIGNPPYVAITGLDSDERARYRRQYLTAVGRFDLYVLFFEQALRLLKPDGRLVFVTPEKFLYVQSASQLRQQLAAAGVEDRYAAGEEGSHEEPDGNAAGEDEEFHGGEEFRLEDEEESGDAGEGDDECDGGAAEVAGECDGEGPPYREGGEDAEENGFQHGRSPRVALRRRL